jgi:LytS/YehU family sensor histidine kinase
MLLQPYIENCIRHGIMHKNSGKGIIDIQFNLKERNLVCSVTDNGVGREAANAFKSMQHVSYQSKGISLTGQRIKMMNKNNESDIILNIEDLVDSNGQPSGTRITIVVPLEQID